MRLGNYTVKERQKKSLWRFFSKSNRTITDILKNNIYSIIPHNTQQDNPVPSLI